MADPKNTQHRKDFQKRIAENAEKLIDAETQQMLNTPWSDPKTALSHEDKAFLETLVKQIESGSIDLLKPSSIIHEPVFDKLSAEKKSQATLWVNAMLALIRQVYDFYKNPFDNNSDMMISMMRELRLKKEMLEKEIGDVLKI
mgnify:CR=1 FL=1